MSKKNKKTVPPRVKRMQRPARLQSAKQWIRTYTGKNIVRGYCNHFAVDWRCAVLELQILGVAIDPSYIAQREKTDAEQAKQRQEKRRQPRSSPRGPDLYADAFSAYLNDDYPALHAFETDAWPFDQE
ncbi:MAG: hypothetical protein JNL67_20865 [Planctomycetaceae bacterium]|nr:hypothetical protein [Planctomycetaceae bacterium]